MKAGEEYVMTKLYLLEGVVRFGRCDGDKEKSDS